MNNDLISRSELKKALTSTPYNDYDDLIRTENLIDNAPTVEGRLMTEKELDERDSDSFETGYIKGICEQRPQGKWYKTGQSFINPNKFRNYGCSNCFYELDEHIRIEPNFCPNCGAYMKGGEE